ncbi:hypothetical protein [Nocardia tengchongensis]|uniref:hypothetical protein n=1 Tax=Nocardia tengchongensis TaxID=2055889 RepID=UPI0036BA8CF4
MFPPEQIRAELATTTADTIVRFRPDSAAIEVFNAAATDALASWPRAFRAGIRQADDLAQQLIDAGWLPPQR